MCLIIVTSYITADNLSISLCYPRLFICDSGHFPRIVLIRKNRQSHSSGGTAFDRQATR